VNVDYFRDVTEVRLSLITHEPVHFYFGRHTMTSFYTHKTSIFFMRVQAYAAHEAGGKLEPFEYELGSLKPDEVEIDVEYCGICQ